MHVNTVIVNPDLYIYSTSQHCSQTVSLVSAVACCNTILTKSQCDDFYPHLTTACVVLYWELEPHLFQIKALWHHPSLTSVIVEVWVGWSLIVRWCVCDGVVAYIFLCPSVGTTERVVEDTCVCFFCTYKTWWDIGLWLVPLCLGSPVLTPTEKANCISETHYQYEE